MQAEAAMSLGPWITIAAQGNEIEQRRVIEVEVLYGEWLQLSPGVFAREVRTRCCCM